LKIGSREVYISDFGVRSWWPCTNSDGRTLKIPGTFSYTAPETILHGQGALTPAVDIWAVGCIGFELLTGRKLFESLDMIQRYCQTNSLPQEQLQILQRVNNIGYLLQGCLQVSPKSRWSVWNLMDQLQQCKSTFSK